MKVLKKIRYDSPVVLTFALVAVVVLWFNQLFGAQVNYKLFSTYKAPFSDPLMYIRLFTHCLGHSSWAHLSGNMVLFLLLGPSLESRYGSKNLFEMIAITAFITGVINNFFFPHVRLLGASGIVFMFIMLTAAATLKSGGGIPISFVLIFVIYVGGEIWDAVTVKDNISQLAHIIGGLCGGAYGFFYAHEKKKR